MSEPKQTISFSEAGSHGNACISPDEGYQGAYFTLIGAGADEDQNVLCKMITGRFNAYTELVDALAQIEEAGLGGYLTPELCADIVVEALAKARGEA